VTFVGLTSASLANTTSTACRIYWGVYSGTTYTSGTPDNGWQTGNGTIVPDQVNNADSTSNNFEVTGVQWELGSIDTPFEHLTYAEELKACHRYYQQFTVATGNSALASGFCTTTSLADFIFNLYEDMRAVPTGSGTAADWEVNIAGATNAATGISFDTGHTDRMKVRLTAATLTAGQGCLMRSDGTTNRKLTFDAEL
jgi:hypothetical protein